MGKRKGSWEKTRVQTFRVVYLHFELAVDVEVEKARVREKGREVGGGGSVSQLSGRLISLRSLGGGQRVFLLLGTHRSCSMPSACCLVTSHTLISDEDAVPAGSPVVQGGVSGSMWVHTINPAQQLQGAECSSPLSPQVVPAVVNRALSRMCVSRARGLI